MRVRDMKWWDLPQVKAIEDDAFASTAWSAETWWSELAMREHCLVVESDGEIAGYAVLAAHGEQSDLQTIALRPESRGQGHAEALLVELLQRAAANGASSTMLEVAADNEIAIGLYLKLGFAPVDERPGYYYRDGQPVPALIMRREEPVK